MSNERLQDLVHFYSILDRLEQVIGELGHWASAGPHGLALARGLFLS